MYRFLAAAIAVAVLGSGAGAQTTTPETAATTAPAPKKVNDLDKVHCRMEAPVDSLIPKRVCTTRRAEQVQRTQVDQFMDRPTPAAVNN